MDTVGTGEIRVKAAILWCKLVCLVQDTEVCRELGSTRLAPVLSMSWGLLGSCSGRGQHSMGHEVLTALLPIQTKSLLP